MSEVVEASCKWLLNGPLPVREVCALVAGYARSFQGTHFATLLGHTKGISALAARDNLLASGSFDADVCVWDLRTMSLLHVLRGHQFAVYALAFLKPEVLAYGSHDGVRVWDFSERTTQTRLMIDRKRAVTALAAVNEDYLAAAHGKSISIWDYKLKKRAAKLVNPTGWVEQMLVLGNGVLVSSGNDGAFILWDVGNPLAGCARLRTVACYGCVGLIALSNNTLLSAGWDEIRILNTNSGAIESRNQADGFQVTHVTVVDGCSLIFALHGGGAVVRSLVTGAELSRFQMPYLMPVLCPLPNGHGLAVGYGVGDEINILY